MSKNEDYLKKIPQYTRNNRHLWSVMQHGTLNKLRNLFLAESERLLRRNIVKSRPYLLIIDPCNYCNLRCPLCPTGLNNLGRQQSMLSFEHFKKYFDPHIPFIFETYLHNWGESLINKEVYKMISYAQSNNVGTNLSSNFVIVQDDDIDNLINSNLEYLVISLDGTSQESYIQYRIRGDYERVVENLSKLLRRRKELNRTTPFVEWQFIVMKQNEHEIAEAKQLADKLGVDKLRFIPVGMPYEFKNRLDIAQKWYPESRLNNSRSTNGSLQLVDEPKPGPCFYLYRSMVVNPDGGISPCCEVYKADRDFANLHDNLSVEEIWNNEKYISARGLFSLKHTQSTEKTVCESCNIFIKPK